MDSYVFKFNSDLFNSYCNLAKHYCENSKHLKGFLAHNFMLPLLLSISFHVGIGNTFKVTNIRNNDITVNYRRKVIELGNPPNYGFPNESL